LIAIMIIQEKLFKMHIVNWKTGRKKYCLPRMKNIESICVASVIATVRYLVIWNGMSHLLVNDLCSVIDHDDDVLHCIWETRTFIV
jgi:hypothetical protein